MAEPGSKEKLNKKEILALYFILLLGLILRAYNLGSKGLTLDEAVTVDFTSINSVTGMLKALSNGCQQPLYYLIIHYWIKLFGESEFILRLPNIFFSITTLYMTFRLGSLLFDKKVGLISALITTLSVFQINYSQEARPYMLSTLLSLISIYSLIQFIYKRNFKNISTYIISTTLLLYNHSLGIFTILAENLFSFISLLFIKEKFKIFLMDWITTQLAVFILFTPWLYTVFSQMYKNEATGLFSWVKDPTLETVLKTYSNYLSSSTLLSVIFCLLLVKMALSGFKKININFYLLLFLITTPIVTMFIVSKVWTPIYIERYTLPASAAFYILIAALINQLSKYRRLMVLLPVVFLSFVAIYDFNKGLSPFIYREINFKDIVNYIESNAEKNDLIIFDAWYIEHLLYDHYSKRTDLIKKELSKEYKKDRFINPDDCTSSSFNSFNRIWLLYSHPLFNDKPLEKIIKNTHKLIKSQKYLLDTEIKLYAKST